MRENFRLFIVDLTGSMAEEWCMTARLWNQGRWQTQADALTLIKDVGRCAHTHHTLITHSSHTHHTLITSHTHDTLITHS